MLNSNLTPLTLRHFRSASPSALANTSILPSPLTHKPPNTLAQVGSPPVSRHHQEPLDVTYTSPQVRIS